MEGVERCRLVYETKVRNKGKYAYTYTLKTNEDVINTKAPAEEKKHIDSDGNVPLDGQVNIDDVICIFQPSKINKAPKSTFDHFKQRTYDFDKLKRALLYGEPYELHI